jgi:DNA polymerase III epsilon subunit-like protein
VIRSDFPSFDRYSLGYLRKQFEISRDTEHRAEADVIALYQLLHKAKMVKKFSA